GAEQSLYVGRVEDLERFLEQLHDLDAQDVEVAEREPLQIVAQVEAGAPDDRDRAETRIVSTLAYHVGNPLVAPEQRHLVNEMGEGFGEGGLGAGADRPWAPAVVKDPPISSQAVSMRVAQDFAAIELIQCKGALAARQPHRAGSEQLLQLLHDA